MAGRSVWMTHTREHDFKSEGNVKEKKRNGWIAEMENRRGIITLLRTKASKNDYPPPKKKKQFPTRHLEIREQSQKTSKGQLIPKDGKFFREKLKI